MTTLAKAFDYTLKTRWVGRPREACEIRSIKAAEEFFGTTRPIDDLHKWDIESYVKHLRSKGNSPSTINSKLSTISVTLNHHRELGLTKNALTIQKVKHSSNARLRYFDEALIAKIEKVTSYDFRSFFQWSLETGMRPSESRSIHMSDIRDMTGFGLLVDLRKTKNGDQRSIPLTKKAKYALNTRNTPYPWEMFTEKVIRAEWQKIRTALGLNHEWVFYLTRHTCATRLLSQGVNIKVVQDWMGHKDINMTLKYAKLVPKDLVDARNLLDRIN